VTGRAYGLSKHLLEKPLGMAVNVSGKCTAQSEYEALA